MMDRRSFLSFTAGLVGVSALPAGAQLLLVTGEYRITEFQQDNERFGVAVPEANPNVTQNWVYMSTKTNVQLRHTNSEGWHKDETLNFYQFFEKARKGEILKVSGGRRWDGAISAKTIWMGFPNEHT